MCPKHIVLNFEQIINVEVFTFEIYFLYNIFLSTKKA